MLMAEGPEKPLRSEHSSLPVSLPVVDLSVDAETVAADEDEGGDGKDGDYLEYTHRNW